MKAQELSQMLKEEYFKRPSERYRYLEDITFRIEYLTGYSIEQLLEKVVAGWTLEPPKTKPGLESLGNLSVDETED